MPLLRKTGVRSPFLPGPLLTEVVSGAGALRPVVVIGAIIPTLLFGAIAQPTSVRPRAQNADPLRPTTIVVDAPDATLIQSNATWIGRLPRDAPAVQPDRVRAATVLIHQPPVPNAALWKPEAARLLNIDPLRPLLHDGPTLPMPQALGASVWKGEAPRIPTADPLRPVVAQGPPFPIAHALGVVLWRPAPVRPPNTDPVRPVFVWGRTLDPPGAIVVQARALRETPAAQPGRVLPATVIVVGDQSPGRAAQLQLPIGVRWTPAPDPLVTTPTQSTLATSGVGTATLMRSGIGTAMLMGGGLHSAALATSGLGVATVSDSGSGGAGVASDGRSTATVV